MTCVNFTSVLSLVKNCPWCLPQTWNSAFWAEPDCSFLITRSLFFMNQVLLCPLLAPCRHLLMDLQENVPILPLPTLFCYASPSRTLTTLLKSSFSGTPPYLDIHPHLNDCREGKWFDKVGKTQSRVEKIWCLVMVLILMCHVTLTKSRKNLKNLISNL